MSEKEVKYTDLSEEDFAHALAWSYASLVSQVKQRMDDGKLPNDFFNRLSLKAHQTLLAEFRKRFGDIKEINFYF